MIDIIISFLTFVLILISLFLVLVILMQRADSNAGMGSAFGGGVTESAFGADTANILTKATKWSSIAFFVIALGLYLLYMSKDAAAKRPVDLDLPDIPTASATTDLLRDALGAGQDVTIIDNQVVPLNAEGSVAPGTVDNAAETVTDGFATEPAPAP